MTACFRTKIRSPKAPATGVSAVQKLETRRLQTLIRQREKLEADVRALENEVLRMVRMDKI